MMIYRHSIAVVVTWHHRHVATRPFSTRHHHFHYHHTTGLETHTNDDRQSPAMANKGSIAQVCAFFYFFFFAVLNVIVNDYHKPQRWTPIPATVNGRARNASCLGIFFLLLFLYTNDYYSTPGLATCTNDGRRHQDTTTMAPCHSHHHFKIMKQWPRRRKDRERKGRRGWWLWRWARDADASRARCVFIMFFYYYTNIIYKYDNGNGATPHSINAWEAIKGPSAHEKGPNDVLSSFGP